MGCFVTGAKVSIPGGKKAIEEIRVGDLALYPKGPKELVETVVRDVFESEEELISLVTTHGAILTTADQIFPCLDNKDRKTDDLMGRFIGYLLDDEELVYVEVVAIISKRITAKVFHLHVDEPNRYIVDGFLVHNKGGGGTTTTSTQATIAPELRGLFSQTGDLLQGLQMGEETGSVLDQFMQSFPQFIPQASQGQRDIMGRQRERAFGSMMTLPEQYAMMQSNELVGGPIGSSPATQAAMAAATPGIENQMEMAGLGRSGALPQALASAYGPIVAQEIAGRQAMVPQFLNLGKTLTERESTLLGEAGTSEEANRQLMAQQAQADTQDMLRRQNLAQSFITGVLGGFPTVTGQTGISKTSGGSAGK